MRRLTLLLIGLTTLALAQNGTSMNGTSSMGGSMNGTSMSGGPAGGMSGTSSMGSSSMGESMHGTSMMGGSMGGTSMMGGSMNGSSMNGGNLDHSFVTAAGEGNNFEIEAAMTALKNSSNSKVKEFAQKMITDHSKLGNDVKAALAGSGLKLPSGVSAAQKVTLLKLKNLKGAAFDAAYKNAMVMSHAQTYALFSDYIKHGDLRHLKQVIEMYAPVVKMHWDMAKVLPSN